MIKSESQALKALYQMMTIDFPTDLASDIEEIIKSRHCTFDEFCVEATRKAIIKLKSSEQIIK